MPWWIHVRLFLKNKINFFAKNHCEIQVRAHCTCMHIILDKIQYFISKFFSPFLIFKLLETFTRIFVFCVLTKTFWHFCLIFVHTDNCYYICSGKTNWRGRLCTVGLLVRVACFTIQENNYFIKKQLTTIGWYKEVSCTEPSTWVRLQCIGKSFITYGRDH